MLKYTDHNITEIEPHLVPTQISIIVLRNAVVLPGMLLPVFVARKEALELLEAEGKAGSLVGLFTQKYPENDEITLETLYPIGCLAEIHKIDPLGDDGYQVLLQGIHKIKLENIIQSQPYLIGKITPLTEAKDYTEEEVKALQNLVIEYVQVNPNIPNDVIKYIKKMSNPSALANQIVFFSQKSIEDRIHFLEIHSIKEKIQKLYTDLKNEINHLKVDLEIQETVTKDTHRIQKEYYLRKQLETIQKELGEHEDDHIELEKKLSSKFLPDSMRTLVNKELMRLRRVTSNNQSGGVEVNQIRNWLELVVDLNWEVPVKKNISLQNAKQILDEDHYGIEEAKKRIIEFLAIEKQVGQSNVMILCFVGPPGVGKTSLASSIARALDRPFHRASLGGIRDEAEIRGHRRTYIGAMEGKILKGLKKVKTSNPVFLLDEIDKLASSYQGDPSAALLEVLDPKQNHNFEDHFLGEPYDLSKIFFICTANDLDRIPAPLIDRMEIIRLPGYTIKEKMKIVYQYLLPQITKDLKLETGQITISETAVKKIIIAHTREAGVRELKRKLETLVQKSVRDFLEKEENNPSHEGAINKLQKIHYEVEDVQKLLGRDRFYNENKENLNIPGIATGLVWTPVGGEILFIETTAYRGRGDIKLSGRLGEVMRESAQTALSFLKSHSKILGLPSNVFDDKDLHIHVPSGAIPKEGPSAGVTILVALTSLLTNYPINENLAMTGEISLRGKVLPVGGIKEKVLAAKVAGIGKIFLPERNRAEFEEIQEEIREGLEISFFEDMLELIFKAIPKLKLKNEEDKFVISINPIPPPFLQ